MLNERCRVISHFSLTLERDTNLVVHHENNVQQSGGKDGNQCPSHQIPSPSACHGAVGVGIHGSGAREKEHATEH